MDKSKENGFILYDGPYDGQKEDTSVGDTSSASTQDAQYDSGAPSFDAQHDSGAPSFDAQHDSGAPSFNEDGSYRMSGDSTQDTSYAAGSSHATAADSSHATAAGSSQATSYSSGQSTTSSQGQSTSGDLYDSNASTRPNAYDFNDYSSQSQNGSYGSTGSDSSYGSGASSTPNSSYSATGADSSYGSGASSTPNSSYSATGADGSYGSGASSIPNSSYGNSASGSGGSNSYGSSASGSYRNSASGLSGATNGYDFNNSQSGSGNYGSGATSGYGSSATSGSGGYGSSATSGSGGYGSSATSGYGSSATSGSGGSGHNSNFNSNFRQSKDKADSWFKKPIKFTRLKAIIAAAIIIVLAMAAGFGGSLISSSVAPYGTSSLDSGKSSGSYKLEDATGSKLTVSEITAKNLDSVVEIKTESVATDSWMRQYVTEGAGSGVIFKSNGYIITNNHVISGASKIRVTLSNDKEYTAKLVGTDSQLDVAVLKINAKGLKAVTFGNSNQIKVGDVAVAIGNPLGTLGGTVTAGIISATQRSLTIDNQSMNLIQTDASINPGNSGGGLFNGDGQLVGLVVAKSSGSDVEGLGFAIPVNNVANTAEQLMKNGYVKNRANSGMSYTETNSSSDSASDGSESDLFDYFMGGGEESQTTQDTPTVCIAQVISDEAKDAGFQEGDYVYSVDGQKIDCFATLKSIIQSHKPGDKVTYVVYRQNQKLKLKLTLVEEGKSQS